MLELHEVKAVNRGLEKLRGLNFAAERFDAVAAHRRPRADPALLPGSTKASSRSCSHLRVLVADIRKIGEHGIKIVRFKGLGEMDGEELWDTTLDPSAPHAAAASSSRTPSRPTRCSAR